MVDKSEISLLFVEKQEKLLNEVDNFKYAAEHSALGDYAEKGLLMTMLLILIED